MEKMRVQSVKSVDNWLTSETGGIDIIFEHEVEGLDSEYDVMRDESVENLYSFDVFPSCSH